MKTTVLASILCIFLFNTPPSIYDFKVQTLGEEKQISLSNFKGKKILIVNTACKSPYTFQLEELQKLYRAYNEKLVVIAFPAGSDFGDQEFKTNNQIMDFFTYTYGITFPVAEKTTVIGSGRHPVFTYLLDEANKLGYDEPVIKWNFTKFLLDENGQLVTVFPADVTPLSTEVTSYLNNTRTF
ncbi:MAG: glutathione peroxidase [Chitinophagaceae bacterium]